MASSEHARLGGEPHRIKVESLLETVVDTSSDVVRCAAAVAAWKSLGRDESDAVISYGSNGWEVGFATSGVRGDERS
jgi:hypothetical protein